MTTPYCLVVIDMQPTFRAANDERTIENVKELINKAKDDNADIIILEYLPDYHGKTHQEIIDLVDGYEFARTVIKDDDNGSYAIKAGGYSNSFFMLCGVNTSACVARTARGMSQLFPESQINIDFSACNQPAEWEEQYPETQLDNLEQDLNSYHNISCLV